ncbi:MAG: hypothetical protein IKK82_12155 [Kiritimatiellae bacterium]|nr:hypothetical protein [Kiritimatiellia bacterium]
MGKNTFLIAGAALLAGVAIGWTAKPAPAGNATSEVQDSGFKNKRRISDSSTRVKTVTTVVTNVVQSTVTNTVKVAEERPRGPGDFMADLERMKTENPERYASMTNRMAQFRNRMTRRTESKLDTLASIDTKGWSRSQIENHEKYQDLIAKRAEMMDIIRHDSGATKEERDAAFGELHKLGRELHETSVKERNTLLDKTFQELGYSGSDAKEIRETIKTIYSTTEEWGGPRGPRGRGERHGRK